MITTLTVRTIFHLPEERQAAEEFQQKHKQYGWFKGQADDEIWFEYKHSTEECSFKKKGDINENHS